MKYNIQEELEKFKLLTKYDSSKTLNENNQMIQVEQTMGYVPPTKTAATPAATTPATQTPANTTNVTSFQRPQFKELLESCKSRPTPKTNLDADAVAKLAYAGISGLGTNNENIKSAFDKLNTVDDFCAFSNKYFELYKETIYDALFNETFLNFAPSVGISLARIVQSDKLNASTVKKPKVVIPIPTELKDIDGVKSFQDWADANQAGWATGFPEGKLNKGAGYGAFGPRTQKAWTAYDQEYLQAGKDRQVDTAINNVTGTLQAKTGQPLAGQTRTDLNQLRTRTA
jgi:hypothetical protein